MATAKVKALPCPDCDEGPFQGPQGLGRHRAAKHGTQGAARNGSGSAKAASNKARRSSDVVWMSKDKERMVLVDTDENVWLASLLQ